MDPSASSSEATSGSIRTERSAARPVLRLTTQSWTGTTDHAGAQLPRGERERLEAILHNCARRMDIVVRGNVAKFSQSDKLLRALRATGDRTLVEASPFDRIWGIGLRGDDPRVEDPAQWQGENLLGVALMDVRRRLCPPAPG